jgi:hypothetical protein
VSATIGAMPQPPAKAVHSFRVEDDIWDEAMRIATERRESLSDVVLRKALVAYIKKNGSK